MNTDQQNLLLDYASRFLPMDVPGDIISVLASEFAMVIREWLSQDELNEVLARNARYSPSVDAVHDFCDANMAMEEAFQNLGLPAPGDVGDECDAAGLLWHAAWVYAKRARYWADVFPAGNPSTVGTIVLWGRAFEKWQGGANRCGWRHDLPDGRYILITDCDGQLYWGGRAWCFRLYERGGECRLLLPNEPMDDGQA